MTTAQLESLLRKEIPLANAMQLAVESVHQSGVSLSAPLAPNTNHKSTAFGGSIHSLAVLSCLGLVTHCLEAYSIDYVVIQSSQMDYLRPIQGEFRADAKFTKADGLTTFLTTLEKRKLARIALYSEVFSGGELCAVLNAKFVASLKN